MARVERAILPVAFDLAFSPAPVLKPVSTPIPEAQNHLPCMTHEPEAPDAVSKLLTFLSPLIPATLRRRRNLPHGHRAHAGRRGPQTIPQGWGNDRLQRESARPRPIRA